MRLGRRTDGRRETCPRTSVCTEEPNSICLIGSKTYLGLIVVISRLVLEGMWPVNGPMNGLCDPEGIWPVNGL